MGTKLVMGSLALCIHRFNPHTRVGCDIQERRCFRARPLISIHAPILGATVHSCTAGSPIGSHVVPISHFLLSGLDNRTSFIIVKGPSLSARTSENKTFWSVHESDMFIVIPFGEDENVTTLIGFDAGQNFIARKDLDGCPL